MRTALYAIAVLFVRGAAVSAAEAGPAAPIDAGAWRAFAARHCLECHGPRRQESDLRLDTLAIDPADPATAEIWAAVVARLDAGEMPPEDRPRPTSDELTRAVEPIRHGLAAAARLAGVRPGRGPRRLNRVEYQNSVNELLGTDLDLAGYFPEDGLAGGFDKVGRALNISAVQVERYMEAADAALSEALTEREPTPSTIRRFNFWDDNGVARRTFEKNGVWAENQDAVLIWYTNDKFHYVQSFQAPVRGKYRVRVQAYGTSMHGGQARDGDPVVLALHGGDFRSSNRVSHRVGFFTTEWDRPRVFETVDLLDAGHTFKVTIAGRLPRTFRMLEFSGPALAVQWIEIEGPLDDGSAERRKREIYDGVDPDHATRADAQRLLRRFAERAFRRPVTDADLAPYQAIMGAQFDAGAGFRQALAVGMKSVLCSPKFLFLDRSTVDGASVDAAKGDPVIAGPSAKPDELDTYDLASRLSYFLWTAPPDRELLSLAADGRLADPQIRRDQVRRMLADPKAAAFTRHFLDGWLDLKAIDFTTPDKELYPEFDEPLGDAMLRESRLFFDELVRHDLSVLNVVDSDFAVVNERLARHYGLVGVRGGEMRKVTLADDSVRGGVLTQAAVLKVTADGTVTSPVLRGVWLLDRIMGRPVPPPPPGVPGLEPDVRGATTIRSLLARHREQASCGTCHKKIDPPGFALENFDPIGAWRVRYRIADPNAKPPANTAAANRKRYVEGPAVEAGDRLPDGREFDDVREFKTLLLSEPEAIAENFVTKLLVYALGREPDFADREAVRAIVRRTAGGSAAERGAAGRVSAGGQAWGVRTLMEELAASEVFGRR